MSVIHWVRWWCCCCLLCFLMRFFSGFGWCSWMLNTISHQIQNTSTSASNNLEKRHCLVHKLTLYIPTPYILISTADRCILLHLYRSFIFNIRLFVQLVLRFLYPFPPSDWKSAMFDLWTSWAIDDSASMSTFCWSNNISTLKSCLIFKFMDDLLFITRNYMYFTIVFTFSVCRTVLWLVLEKIKLG